MFTDTCVFVTQIPYIDYEIYLGPIGLYDWQGATQFNVEFARSLPTSYDSGVNWQGASPFNVEFARSLPTFYDSGVKYHCQGHI